MDYEVLLQRGIYDLQSRLGTFMQNGSRLYAVKDRIKPYLTNAKAKDIAVALDAKADGLLANVKDIQARGMVAVDKATIIKTQVGAVLKKVDGVPVNLSVLGSAFASLVGESGKAAIMLKDLAALALDMEKATASVNALDAGVKDLDAYAQGKGISARLEQAMSFGAGNISKVVTILGVGLAVWLFGPTLIGKVAGAVKRNPRRRKR
jgi:hypothetical protein